MCFPELRKRPSPTRSGSPRIKVRYSSRASWSISTINGYSASCPSSRQPEIQKWAPLSTSKYGKENEKLMQKAFKKMRSTCS